MKGIENFFSNVVGKFSERVMANRVIQALSGAFVMVMPITIGVAAIAVAANLPIQPWQELLTGAGINTAANDFISLTLSLLAIYIVGAVAYKYTYSIRSKEAMMVTLITIACYLALIPIQTSEQGVTMIELADLGSNGIFVAMLIGIIIPAMYHKLMELKISIKMPDTVPENVSQALSPTFVNMIIFTGVFAVRYVFTLTPYGDIFNCISTLIQAPILNVGASAWGIILVQTVTVFLWFFGIHPATLSAVAMPVLMGTMPANIEAYAAGKPLPFLAAAVVYYVLVNDAVGNTLALSLNTLFAKSEKYKAMKKLVIPANIFNINEPVIFGFPVMLNPLYFIPLILATLGNGIIAVLYMKLITIPVNPAVYLAWVTPRPVFTFLAGGWQFLLLWVVCLAFDYIVWYPFFRVDDRKEYEKEQQIARKNSAPT